MEELKAILRGIECTLMEMNDKMDRLEDISAKLDDIRGTGINHSISEVCGMLDEIKGTGIFDSISAVGDQLDEIHDFLKG